MCIRILQCHIFEKTKNLKFLADVNMNNLCQQQIVWQLWWEATMTSIFLLPHKMWSFGRSYARFTTTTTTIFWRHTNVYKLIPFRVSPHNCFNLPFESPWKNSSVTQNHLQSHVQDLNGPGDVAIIS